MTQKDKFTFNIGVLFLSYAYAITGYQNASLLLAITAVLLAIHYHSFLSLKKHTSSIILSSMFMINVVKSVGLDEVIAYLPLLSVSNVIFAYTWMESSMKAIQKPMYYFFVGGLGFMVLTLIFPKEFVSYLFSNMPNSLDQQYCLIFLIYGPMIGCYVYKKVVNIVRNSREIVNYKLQ